MYMRKFELKFKLTKFMSGCHNCKWGNIHKSYDCDVERDDFYYINYWFTKKYGKRKLICDDWTEKD